MRIAWPLIYLLLWIYRSTFSVIGQTIISRFTSLGDSGRYQANVFSFEDIGAASDFGGWTRVTNTALTEILGAGLNFVTGGNPIPINIGFQSIAFIGILAVLRALAPQPRIAVTALVMLPSFSVWSSVASKEAIVVFAMGLILAPLIHIYRGHRVTGLVALPGLAIIAVYKPHFFPAILFLGGGIIVTSRIYQKSLIVLVGFLASLAVLYLLRDQVSALSLEIAPHFLGFGSSRTDFFVNPDDVFRKAPLGMFLAFFGPTFGEASSGVLQMASFLESTVVTIVLLWFLMRNGGRTPVFSILVVAGTLFWILFATYPLGVFNAGSAVRYRTGYEMLIFVLFAFILSRQNVETWISSRRGKIQGDIP